MEINSTAKQKQQLFFVSYATDLDRIKRDRIFVKLEQQEEMEEAAIAREDWLEVASTDESDGDGEWVRPKDTFYAELNLVILLLWLASRSNLNEDDLNWEGGEGEPKNSKQEEAEEDEKMVKSKGKGKDKSRHRESNELKLLQRTRQSYQPKPKDLRHCRKM